MRGGDCLTRGMKRTRDMLRGRCGLVAAAGGLGFATGLLAASAFWGALHFLRQLLVAWWGQPLAPHDSGLRALREREVRGAIPRAQWS